MLSYKKCLLSTGLILLSAFANANKNDIPLSYAAMDGMHVRSDGIILGAGGFRSDQLLYIQQNGVTFDYISGFAGPIDITETPDGNLFVTNFNNATVSKVTPDGQVEEFAQVLVGPSGITSDPAGNLYVSHYGVGNGDGDTVLKITPEGEVSTYATGGYLDAPIGTAIDENGNLYVANFNNGLIIQINSEGEQTLIGEIPSDEGFAIGHLAYANNRLFISNPIGGKVFKIRIKQRRIGPMREVNASKRVTFPNGIAFNPVSNAILVAEVQKSSKLVSISLGKRPEE
jgi:sugar lactone lactonase YvrE